MRRLSGTHRRAWMTVAAAIAAGIMGAALVVAHQGAGESTTVPGALVASVAPSSWTPITTLTAPKWGGDSAVISVDNSGDFLTAWSGISNTNPNCQLQTQIRIRYRTGKLGPVEQLTPCDHPSTSFPVVASNASGYSIAAWIFNPSALAIQARTISPTGKLGPLLTVTRKGDQADLVNVGISPAGEALVAWHQLSTVLNSPNSILGRFISPGSKLGPVMDIGGATGQLPPWCSTRPAPRLLDGQPAVTSRWHGASRRREWAQSRRSSARRTAKCPALCTGRPGWPMTATETPSCLPPRTRPSRTRG